ncbi:hypothetical protein V6N13_142561 [Hibiscus sabdariffa]
MTRRNDVRGRSRVPKVMNLKDSVTGRVDSLYRQVVGVLDEIKCVVLDTCVVECCKGSLRGASLVAKLREAGLQGCSMMRVSRSIDIVIVHIGEGSPGGAR